MDLCVDLQDHIQTIDDRLPVTRITVIGITRNHLCTTEVASAWMQKAQRRLASLLYVATAPVDPSKYRSLHA
jgi:hypothetical protein